MIYVPYPELHRSASVLHDAALQESARDARRVLDAIIAPMTPSGVRTSRSFHAWRDHPSGLAVYLTMLYHEIHLRGGEFWAKPYNHETWLRSPAWDREELPLDAREGSLPGWLGREDIHLSHRRALLKLDAWHYSKENWRLMPSHEIVWP